MQQFAKNPKLWKWRRRRRERGSRGRRKENKGEGREAASKKVGLVTLASVASIVANVAFHAMPGSELGSTQIKYSMQMKSSFREGSTFKVLVLSVV